MLKKCLFLKIYYFLSTKMYSFQFLNSLVGCEFTRDQVCFLGVRIWQKAAQWYRQAGRSRKTLARPDFHCVHLWNVCGIPKSPVVKKQVLELPSLSSIHLSLYLPVSGSQSELSEPSPIQPRRAQAGG